MLDETLFGIERFRGKAINCLGDSITSDYSTDNSSWVQMLRESIPATIRNYGIAGTTIADFGERTDCFTNRYAEMDPQADVIIVFGGINDFNHSVKLGEAFTEDTSTFYGALNVMCKKLIERYPVADIMFITPMHAFDFKDYPHWNEDNAQGFRLKDYRDAILQTCGYYSIPVLDLYQTSGITPDVSVAQQEMIPDGLHPGKVGRKRIARKILNFLAYQL